MFGDRDHREITFGRFLFIGCGTQTFTIVDVETAIKIIGAIDSVQAGCGSKSSASALD